MCGSAASTELRGGRLARAVPTANDPVSPTPDSDPKGLTSPALAGHECPPPTRDLRPRTTCRKKWFPGCLLGLSTTVSTQDENCTVVQFASATYTTEHD